MMASSADVDLTNCDREPIHKLGRIQPFGALIAVDRGWTIAHVSQNFRGLTGAPAMPAIGEPLPGIVAAPAFSALRSAVAALLHADHAVHRQDQRGRAEGGKAFAEGAEHGQGKGR